MKKEINWKKYKIRRCYTVHGCEICGTNIRDGDEYYDGGYSRRAHKECVKEKLEAT